MPVHFAEIYSQCKVLDSTNIYEWIKDIWIDWSNCGILLITMLLCLSYAVFKVLTLLPPSIREIRRGVFGLWDMFRIGFLTGIWPGASNRQEIILIGILNNHW